MPRRFLLLLLACPALLAHAQPAPAPDYARDIQPLITRLCLDCHSTAKAKGDLDLERFQSREDVLRDPEIWQQVEFNLALEEMPPADKPQPSAEERARLLAWVRATLGEAARATAGDPGPVVLRRLSNAEYTHTLRDLTGLDALEPTRGFPVDGAAGEGFANVGSALVMSPALLEKYLDAAKEVAAHLVPLPEGVAFSPFTTRRDWTNERLDRIRALYARHTSASGASEVDLQGVKFKTNDGGRLPLRAYLAALLADRAELAAGTLSPAACAARHGLNPRYLDTLWQTLRAPPASPLLRALQARWAAAQPADLPVLVDWVTGWQNALWKFNNVGQIGKTGGPSAWMTPVDRRSERQEIRVKIPPTVGTNEVSLTLFTQEATAGWQSRSTDGMGIPPYDSAVPAPSNGGRLSEPSVRRDSQPVELIWERPRLVSPGRPDLLLRDVGATHAFLLARREALAQTTAACLAAAEAVRGGETNRVALALRHAIDPGLLDAWCRLLGLGGGVAGIEGHITDTSKAVADKPGVSGWVGADALSVLANASDQDQRIPGLLRARGVAVHPTPSRSVVVLWRSPTGGLARVSARVQDAHTTCGNGVAWVVEQRGTGLRQRLAEGVTEGDREARAAVEFPVAAGDGIALVINPRDGSHVCDLTAIDLTVEVAGARWDLATEIAPDILAGNPHPDARGTPGVWHFLSEPVAGPAGVVLPPDSLLTHWLRAPDSGERTRLAAALADLLARGPAHLPADAPDVRLHALLTRVDGPLLTVDAGAPAPVAEGGWGLDPKLHSVSPEGSLTTSSAAPVRLRLPAALVEGRELVVSVRARTGVGQARVALDAAAPPPGPWPETPLLVAPGSPEHAAWEAAQRDFRDLFPAALCYAKIVPVDEVITLVQFHREDEPLGRLMLDDAERAELDRLWDELRFVSQEALTAVDAYDQLWQFATQDADPKVFNALRQPIRDRAAAFRAALSNAEPRQVRAVVDLAGLAWRRPLAPAETNRLHAVYASLRGEELAHDEALRLLLARILVAPPFLYKQEAPGEAVGAVNDWELATRLSYFLTSSAPDAELRRAAAAGRLHDPAELRAHTSRLREGPLARRLAEEFGLYWLHLADFDRLDEKSERHFPDFLPLRAHLREEPVRFLTDLFQRGGSALDLIGADHGFLNGPLAAFYGVPGVEGPEWRRVEGLRARGRGGMLAFAATLAKQSGASRTSPILRGTWLGEVLLGERLPKPPKGVPVLPEDESALEGLTVRQLVEKHSSDPACIRCHKQVDPFGFSLERYDAIGRLRTRDLAGRELDTRVRLPDGTVFDGLDGLRDHFLTRRRDDFGRQFARKLLGYALGRSVQLSDQPLLDEMQRDLAPAGWPVGDILDRIVCSPQFRNIRGRRDGE